MTLPYNEPPQTLEATSTNTIIRYTSNHPTHHKYAAIRYLFSRLNSYNLQHEDYQHELNVIHKFLQNSSFTIKPHKPHILKPAKLKGPKTPKKWASFTYIGRETSYITHFFRQTDLKIALRTKNTIGNLLTHENPTRDIYSQSGAYKLSCSNCNKAYIGQTGYDSPRDTENTKPASKTITKPTASQNALMKRAIPLAI